MPSQADLETAKIPHEIGIGPKEGRRIENGLYVLRLIINLLLLGLGQDIDFRSIFPRNRQLECKESEHEEYCKKRSQDKIAVEDGCWHVIICQLVMSEEIYCYTMKLKDF